MENRNQDSELGKVLDSVSREHPKLPREPRLDSEPERAYPFTLIGFLLGLLLGYPVSYYFQPEKLRLMFGLGEYIREFPKVIQESELVTGVVLGFVVAVPVCAFFGFIADKVSQNRN